MMKKNTRTAAAQVLTRVTRDGQALRINDGDLPSHFSGADRALTKALCFGVCRHYFSLNHCLSGHLSKKLKPKDEDIKNLLLVGIFQLLHLRTATHAAISETVEGTRQLKKPWASKLVNAILRQVDRQQSRTIDTDQASARPEALDHPQWIIDRIQQQYPASWSDILANNNRPAPLFIRVNEGQCQREQYLELLEKQGIDAVATPCAKQGIQLKQAVGVSELPHFDDGWCSVQDQAAQICGGLLAPQKGERILDACAAPGGKTGHLLELTQGQLDLLALDSDASRSEKITENLQRIGLSANITVAHGEQLDTWWNGLPFDGILVDAPCSGSGVIRRHPDIKLHRSPQDIKQLAALQSRLLDTLWTTLKPGGRLLYATCSVFHEENAHQIKAFLERQQDAEHVPIQLPDYPHCHEQTYGFQVLPGTLDMDGFFYALLIKSKT